MLSLGICALVALLGVTLRMGILARRDPGRTFRISRGDRFAGHDDLPFSSWMRRYFWLYLAVAIFFLALGVLQRSS